MTARRRAGRRRAGHRRADHRVAGRRSAAERVARRPAADRAARRRPAAEREAARRTGDAGVAARRPAADRVAGRRPAVRRAAARRAARAVTVLLALVLGAAAVAGCGGLATTHHKPGTGHQEATGDNGTLLAARDGAGHRLREVPAAGAPAVWIEARPDSEGGWNVHLLVERFRFTPESTGGAALLGRGHARLLVDGRETTRAYGPWVHVPAGVGARTLTARLLADDHTVWAVAGRPVETTVRLGAGAPAGASSDAGADPPGTPAAPGATPATPAAPGAAGTPAAPGGTPAAPAGRTLTVTVTGGSVQPPPSRVELKKGERLTLQVTSDRADTLHVHGYDREIALSPGRQATLTLTADRTGLFEVETHESGLVLTQLVVR
ncbi:hypothetical protein [Streptomyces sp. NPDC053431]|uniref:hypothetical protein n=1 Tax=Streptomyces sp. NPDC053431 TaxID=3365703 RepID=UPI0037D3736E